MATEMIVGITVAVVFVAVVLIVAIVLVQKRKK
jgi:hypothetical protein